jgi:NADPH-dependent 2,4-dienoyl-CoA reductase/sulfur reductase-like enzyme
LSTNTCSAADIYASGDIACWPDPRTGQQIRVEHWVVAERQGQVPAQNMLGRKQAFGAIPFFWSQHYAPSFPTSIAPSNGRLDIDRDLATNDDAVTFWHHGRKLAVATIGRDLDCLRAELAFEEEPTAWQRAFPQNISD